MLDTSNNFFDLISLKKILKIGPFSDYIGSKMVKNGLKIFSTWILKGVAYMNKKNAYQMKDEIKLIHLVYIFNKFVYAIPLKIDAENIFSPFLTIFESI